MTTQELLTFAGIISAFLLGVFNLVYRGPSMGMVERSQYMKNMNDSVELATKRALDAEKKVVELEARMEIIEGKVPYRITFDVTFGPEPKIENAEIRIFTNKSQRFASAAKAD